MKFVTINDRLSIGLAETDVLLDKLDDFLLIHTGPPCVSVGDCKYLDSVVDLDYINQNGIGVTRRMSGGGSIFHGSEMLNIVLSKPSGVLTNYILDFLSVLEIPNVTAESNDIFIDGLKICGVSGGPYKSKRYSHAVLIFDQDLSVIDKAIRNTVKNQLKGVSKHSDRLTTIKCHKPELSFESFKSELMSFLYSKFDLEPYEIIDTESVKERASLMYDDYGWVYDGVSGCSGPKIVDGARFYYRIIDGKFDSFKVERKDVDDYSKAAIDAAMYKISVYSIRDHLPVDLSEYIPGINREEVINAFSNVI